MPSTKRLLFSVIVIFSGTYLIIFLAESFIGKTSRTVKQSKLEKELREVYSNGRQNVSYPGSHPPTTTTSITTRSITTRSITTRSSEILLGWRQNVHWESILDLHEYRYLINPENRCKSSTNITLLILVKTRMESAEKRDLVRKTYGEGVFKYNVSAMILFLVGFSGEYNSSQQAQLHEEANIHGDILQEDFIDSYHNLTIKLIMGFKWASTFCSNSDYIMSTDDDVVVDVVNLVNDLENVSLEFRSKFALAEPAISWEVHRDPGDKWYTPHELYSNDTWPPFPRGFAYIVSRDIAHRLYLASQKIAPPIPWDDVYCGMLLQSLDVDMIDIISWFKTRHGHARRTPLLKTDDHYAVFKSGNYPIMNLWKAVEHRYKNRLNL